MKDQKISCIVDYGNITSKRDMVRVLRDLDKVEYVDLINNVIVSKGEGYVIEVYSNTFDSTIIFNNKLHINVNSFDYLEIKTQPAIEINLFSGERLLRLKPLRTEMDNNPSYIEEEIDEQRVATFAQLSCDNEENFYS